MLGKAVEFLPTSFPEIGYICQFSTALWSIMCHLKCSLSKSAIKKKRYQEELQKCIQKKIQGLHVMYETYTIHSCLLPSLGSKSCRGKFRRHVSVYTKFFFVSLVLPNKWRVKRIAETYIGWQLCNSCTSSFLLLSRRQSVKTEQLPLPLQKLLNNGFSRSKCTSLTRPFPQMGFAI